MAYPTIAATNSSTQTSVSDTHTVALPGGIVSGNLLIIVAAIRFGRDFNAISGWTELATGPTVGDVTIGVWYRKADGNEGSTVTLTTTGVGGEGAHRTFRITGAADPDSTPPEAAVGDITVTNSPDPPPVTPTWGPVETLWLAAAVTGGSIDVTGYPVGYVGASYVESNTGGQTAVGLGTATRQATVAAENPGSFAAATSGNTIAATIAVSPNVASDPDVAVVSEPADVTADVAADPTKIETRAQVTSGDAIYDGGVATVDADSDTSGAHVESWPADTVVDGPVAAAEAGSGRPYVDDPGVVVLSIRGGVTMQSINLKRNDTRPVRVGLVDLATGEAVDLSTAASAVWIMDDARTGADKVDRAAVTVIDAGGGIVEWAPSSTHTDTAGVYQAEVEVTWNDGTVQTFPESGYIVVTVEADLG